MYILDESMMLDSYALEITHHSLTSVSQMSVRHNCVLLFNKKNFKNIIFGQSYKKSFSLFFLLLLIISLGSYLFSFSLFFFFFFFFGGGVGGRDHVSSQA
jgi:hypothetical protein